MGLILCTKTEVGLWDPVLPDCIIRVISDWHTLYHKSFKAEKFHSKLYMQTFAKKLSQNPSYFLLNPYLNSAILTFHIKKFHGHAKSTKTMKLFCLKTFLAYSSL